MIRRHQDYFRAKFQSFMKNHGSLDAAGSCLIVCRKDNTGPLFRITGNSGSDSNKRRIPGHFATYKKGINVNKKDNFLQNDPFGVICRCS